MKQIFIGREEEKEILLEALESPDPEMVAVIGRRRVGKTYLIKSVYQEKIVFEVTGIENAPKATQLENFTLQLEEASGSVFPIKTPKSWLKTFKLLINFLKSVQKPDEKQVVFLDELPWLATHKSGFLNGFSYFWNSWANNQNIVVVVCGSAASWMIKWVVNNKGSLHNRITKRVYLAPFTLAETKTYLEARKLHFDHYQIVQLYMTMGGIPHYLKEIKKGKSATQNINRICFSKNGLLKDEFLRLYPSLFANAENHVAIIRTLATKHQGLTRNQIIQFAKIPKGGTATRVLQELEHSGFIAAYRFYGHKKKEKRYRLTDEYSLFYLKFIEGKEYEGKNIWHHLSQTQQYITWTGYAFENLCLKHVPQIKKALGISGIYSLSSTFYHKGTATQPGTQIDLLIDRIDKVINLFEIKFYHETFTISKSYAKNIRTKRTVFKEVTKTKKQLFFVFISPYGLNHNTYSSELIVQEVVLRDLFVEE